MSQPVDKGNEGSPPMPNQVPDDADEFSRRTGKQIVVVQQPGGPRAPPMTPPGPKPVVEIVRMAPIPDCPPGLEYLTQIDQILVHQKIEILELLTGFETENKYIVKNSLGQQIFYAREESSCCQRYCCSNIREFNLIIVDNFDNQVMQLSRPLACDTCLFPCCLQVMEVCAPPGNVIGSIEQLWSIFPSFNVKNASGEVVFRINGPYCTISCCSDVNFEISGNEQSIPIGKISKQWGGLLHEAYTDADMFGINFPLDLDVNLKAVLLGACFLIDFMYFEAQQSNRHLHY